MKAKFVILSARTPMSWLQSEKSDNQNFLYGHFLTYSGNYVPLVLCVADIYDVGFSDSGNTYVKISADHLRTLRRQHDLIAHFM